MAEELGECCRNFRHNAHKDDQRNAVADAACGDLLTQPHQEHGAAHQRDDTGRHKECARRVGQPARLQRNGDAIALEQRQRHGAVARPLVHLLAALLALFLHLFQRGHHGCQKLDDDGGRDIGHDAKGKDPHAANRAAGEHVQNTAETGTCIGHKLAQRLTIDPGNRNIGAKAINDQQAKGKEDALTQIRRFTEGPPRQVGRHLLCSRCHVWSLSCTAPPNRSPVGGAGKLVG